MRERDEKAYVSNIHTFKFNVSAQIQGKYHRCLVNWLNSQMSMSCMLNLVLSDPPGIGPGGNPAPNDEDAGPMVDGETKITVLSGDEDEEGEINHSFFV